MDIASAQERLATVREGIARAARLARREREEITLIAVSKTQDADAIRPLLEGGHRVFGENRVQEAADKWPPLKAEFPDVRLHLIGQLQSNKAGQAAGLFDTVHSVDRPSLVEALARTGRSAECFLQVNLAEEAQKGGCPPGDLPDLLNQARNAGLPVLGLMCIPPDGIEPAPWFALLAELGRRHGVAGLSMGMSGDYETAVMLGATHVRVGAALFGARPV